MERARESRRGACSGWTPPLFPNSQRVGQPRVVRTGGFGEGAGGTIWGFYPSHCLQLSPDDSDWAYWLLSLLNPAAIHVLHLALGSPPLHPSPSPYSTSPTPVTSLSLSSDCAPCTGWRSFASTHLDLIFFYIDFFLHNPIVYRD